MSEQIIAKDVICTFLTSLLGSSWAMYVLGFPLVIRLAAVTGVNLPLCIGAVCGAGIAGEKNCVITSEASVIATALGINPESVLELRVKYSAVFGMMALVFYLIAGIL